MSLNSGGTATRTKVLFGILQSGNKANGGVESITQVMERLAHVDPIVVTQRQSEVNDRWRGAGASVRVWSYGTRRNGLRVGRLRQVWTLARSNVAIYRLIRSEGVVVVHCNDLVSLWHMVFGARAAGVPVLFNLRDVKARDESYGLQWAVAQLARQVIGLSDEMKQALSRRLPGPGIPRRAVPVEYIYSIVDPETMKPASPSERQEIRRQLGIVNDEIAIGYVAAFNEKKAQLALIEQALPHLKARLPSAKIYFVGDFLPGERAYARECQRAVERLGLQDICRFVGFSDRVSLWYQALDLTLIASRQEGMARAMIESIACGTPVVSFDVCSAREILEGHRCGEVVAQGDYSRLVEVIRALVTDVDRMATYGTNGVEAARRLFRPDAVARDYESLYRHFSERTEPWSPRRR